MPFPATIDLDDVAAGTGGFRLRGGGAYDNAGVSVSGAGDVNHDGIDDVIVGASGAGNGSYAGAAYVIFGSTAGFASDLESIALGTAGFEILGHDANDLAGASVSAAGDINGDGIDDLCVGVPGDTDGGYQSGAAYVVFGKASGAGTLVDLDTIALGTGGFEIQGQAAGDVAGHSVSAAGDVNGDGIDDLIVGAFANNGGGLDAGAAYVVFGSTAAFAQPVDLDAIAAGTGGFKVQGQNAEDYAGFSVSNAGDVNGDGRDDLIIGAEHDADGGDDVGAAYLVWGRSTGFATPVDLDSIAAGTGGLKIRGEDGGDMAGASVSAVGDVDADGVDDLIVGAPDNAGGGSYAGAAYVEFGHTGSFAASIDLATIAAGSGGFKIEGTTGDNAGLSVSAADDVNGDGIDDLIVGAPSDNAGGAGAGAAYVVFGQHGGFASILDLATIAAGVGGFKIRGQNAADSAGIAVSAAGDVNHDEIDDLIVGAPGNGSGGDDAGAAYVIFGQHTDAPPLFTNGSDIRDLNLFDLSKFTADQATHALGGNDGVTLSETRNVSLLFFGGDGNDVITGSLKSDRMQGDAGDDRLLGRAGNDFLAGSDGNDRPEGGVGNDTAWGGAGNDLVYGGDGNDNLDGDQGSQGNGNDTVYGGTGSDSLLGGAGTDTLYGDDGKDTLWGGDGNDRVVGVAGNDTAFGNLGNDTVDGGDGDDRLDGDQGALGNGNDQIYGGNGNDVILGGAGNDSLIGGNGDDTITGGAGVDHMRGDAGIDRFVFDDGDTGIGTQRDVIVSFAAQQVINLSAMDANSNISGDQTFTWIGHAALSAPGQLHYVVSGTDKIVEGSTDNDTAAEFQILLQGYAGTPNAGDFIL